MCYDDGTRRVPWEHVGRAPNPGVGSKDDFIGEAAFKSRDPGWSATALVSLPKYLGYSPSCQASQH